MRALTKGTRITWSQEFTWSQECKKSCKKLCCEIWQFVWYIKIWGQKSINLRLSSRLSPGFPLLLAWGEFIIKVWFVIFRKWINQILKVTLLDCFSEFSVHLSLLILDAIFVHRQQAMALWSIPNRGTVWREISNHGMVKYQASNHQISNHRIVKYQAPYDQISNYGRVNYQKSIDQIIFLQISNHEMVTYQALNGQTSSHGMIIYQMITYPTMME